ncbi:TIGR03943 family putative permease subunit [Cohnella candidum]|uniref:TIGR03943 family protein n=1 Tax=Cohnella candidum TaxID=2674991 RepID=A0A3G3K5N1_9BACL|nr:TIGR03943 family protein [Cohnella candidum]AYQ75778.1 TIGR03943 family protein [Cohnella candidum]
MESSSDRRLAMHHAIRGLILGGFAFYIIRLVRTDSLTLYIAPKMALYVKLSALGLYVVAAVQLFQAYRFWMGQREAAECDCGHPPSGPLWKNVAVYALFAAPLLVGFFTPDTTIGSAMASKKGMNLSAASSVKPKSGDALFPSDEYSEAYADYAKRIYKQPAIEVTEKSYLEILTTLDLYLDQFVGKKLTISGFVYRDDTIPAGSFVLGRFAVQCCTADAMPYGVMVSGGPDLREYPNDTWLRVTGTLVKADYYGSEIMGLKLEKAEKIEPAAEPYVSPDSDFGAAAPE